MEEILKHCTFCGGTASATITTTTPKDAFPFLCSQLGVKIRDGCGLGTEGHPPSLCPKCHSCWEEVSVLYSNMQGLVNLLGRRVQQLKTNLVSHEEMNENVTLKQNKDKSSTILGWWYDDNNEVLSTSTPEQQSGSSSIVIPPTSNPVFNILPQSPPPPIKVKSEVEFEFISNQEENEEEQEMEISEILPNLPQSDDEDDDEDPDYHPESHVRSESQGPHHHYRVNSNSNPPARCRRDGQIDKRRGPKPHLPPPSYQKPDQDTDFELLPTMRGNKKVFASGYTYLFAKMGVGKQMWRCELKGKIKCNARLHTTKDLSKLLDFVGEHNHPPTDVVRRPSPSSSSVSDTDS